MYHGSSLGKITFNTNGQIKIIDNVRDLLKLSEILYCQEAWLNEIDNDKLNL